MQTFTEKTNFSLFDTRFGTKRILVSPKNRFSLRSYIDNSGRSLIYLVINDGKERLRISTEIHVPKSSWDIKKQRVKNLPEAEELNLVLANIEARITKIKTAYMLSERNLTSEKLYKEFQEATPEFDFISFMRHKLKFEDFKPRTVKNHNSVINKLQKFQKEVPFHEVTPEFFQRYRKFFQKQNSKVTFNTDLKVFKKYLNIARKEGIRLAFNPEELKVNVDSQRTVYLNPYERAPTGLVCQRRSRRAEDFPELEETGPES